MLVAQPVPLHTPRVIGFDTIARLDFATARRLADAGLAFAFSYVALHPGGASPLDAAHADLLATAGLRVMPVQFARTSGWSAETGAVDGAAAAHNALAAGIPCGTTVWCDLEGRIPSADVAIDYANAWHAAAVVGGVEEPGLYVGAGVPLTGHQLYALLAFRHYWRSFSQVPNVDVRGYQVLQLYPDDQLVEGVRVDLDVVQSDYLGGRPRWATLPPTASHAS